MEVHHTLTSDTKGKFYIEEDGGRKAEMTYSKAGDFLMIIDHTEVSEDLRGEGVGEKMVLQAVALARSQKKRILPLCPFAKSVFDKTPEIQDVLK